MYLPSDTSSFINPFIDVKLNAEGGIPVLCAWPLSGQYGPGARMLYYVLVIVCLFAARFPSIRDSCLAAALLFPAVAAIHALVISSLSETHGPVDLDIFGTFQLLSIGVLTVPITIRYSKTYFESKGRNLVFMWTVLNLAGLLSLIVAFYRADPQTCRDESGGLVTWDQFSNDGYGNNTICFPGCDAKNAIRKDPSNPSQFVLSPHTGMTINTATLLSAACCIPAILSLLSVWQKVMHLNWLKRWRKSEATKNGDKDKGKEKEKEGDPEHEVDGKSSIRRSPSVNARRHDDDDDEHDDEKQQREQDERFLNKRIKYVLGLVERIVFTVCIMAIVILGERNFWSHEMRAGVEPITSIGQWGPIVGAALAVLASVWTALFDGFEASDADSVLGNELEDAGGMYDKQGNPVHVDENGNIVPGRDPARPTKPQGHRGKVNNGIFRILEVWGTPGAERFADDVRSRKYNAFPTIPGEKERNENLERDKERHRIRQATLQRQNSSASLDARPEASRMATLEEGKSLRSRRGSGDTLSPPQVYMGMSGLYENEAGPSNSGSLNSPGPKSPQDARLPHTSTTHHRHENTLHVPRPRKYTHPSESLERPTRRKMSIPVYTPNPEMPSLPMIVLDEAIDTESSDDAVSMRRPVPPRGHTKNKSL